mmetsp:Transcript_30618/g.74613  ORF Transcript_30618/g.74613 Transcript_30618/m.74613 type:complete len:99 (-) Transcript_30618:157-453(-)
MSCLGFVFIYVVMFNRRFNKHLNEFSQLCVEDYKGPNTYAAACELFKDMFSAQVTNALTQKLYTHVTCATDTDQIRTVFLSVKDILLQQSLMNSGLIE